MLGATGWLMITGESSVPIDGGGIEHIRRAEILSGITFEMEAINVLATMLLAGGFGRLPTTSSNCRSLAIQPLAIPVNRTDHVLVSRTEGGEIKNLQRCRW
ncbi:MAG: hypothetical protein IPH27_05485 [Actinomycetales bacterium]|nr:hypothetical protein [Candidatus Phosphoribacter baldrii]